MLQGELFRDGGAVQAAGASEGSRNFLSQRQITISLDKILIWAGVLVVAFILIYSLGIEQGKRKIKAPIQNMTDLDSASHRSSYSNPEVEDQGRRTVLKHGKETAQEKDLNDYVVLEVGKQTRPSDAMTGSAEKKGGGETKKPDQVETTAPKSHTENQLTSENNFPLVDQSRTSDFTVQLVTYESAHLAAKEIDRLKAKGHKGFVIPSGRFYQVCANYFGTKSDAEKVLVNFRAGKRYPDAFVRPVVR